MGYVTPDSLQNTTVISEDHCQTRAISNFQQSHHDGIHRRTVTLRLERSYQSSIECQDRNRRSDTQCGTRGSGQSRWDVCPDMYTLLCRQSTDTGDAVTLRIQATASQAPVSDDKGVP